MTVCNAFRVAVVKIVFFAQCFVIDSSLELCLRCYFGVNFVGSAMLRDLLSAISFARSLTKRINLLFIDIHFTAGDPGEARLSHFIEAVP